MSEEVEKYGEAWTRRAPEPDQPERQVIGQSLAGVERALLGYQQRVNAWMLACFGGEIAADGVERNHRFLEEALELVQSLGCTENEAHQLAAYVFSRAAGEPHQELGGVMVTAAALATPARLDLSRAAEDELARVWTKVAQIRSKQAAKPKHSPLPQAPAAAVEAPRCARCAWWQRGPEGLGPQELAQTFADVLRPSVGDAGAAILESLDLPEANGACTLFECHDYEQVSEDGGRYLNVTRTGSGEATILTASDFGCVRFKPREPAPAGEGEVRNG